MCPPEGVPGTAQERTFIAIKPDGVQRRLIGEIISRFEAKGFRLAAMKLTWPTKEKAAGHYADLSKKGFFAGLVNFFSSGPVCAMVWEGKGAIATGRVMLGATNPADSLPGTIRGDLCVDVGRNICHGSDGPDSAAHEIKFWFSPEEIQNWDPATLSWVYENPPASVEKSSEEKELKVEETGGESGDLQGKFGSNTERTFIAIKPDGVQRGLIGKIIARFESKGFKLAAMRVMTPTKEKAAGHYADLSKKKFFPSLVNFFSSGPICAMVWEGKGSIKTGRVMLGATNPADSLPGTIRGDLCVDMGRNICHGSDSEDSAKHEINFWFKGYEVNSWDDSSAKWVYE